DQAGANGQFAATLRLHGLSAVQDEIQNHLLHLRCVALDRREIVLQFQNNFGVDELEFVSSQSERGADQLVQVRRRALRLGTARKCQQVRDNASDAGGFCRDQAEILAEFSSASRRIRAIGIRRSSSMERLSTPETGLLISCATLAESWPRVARRSAWMSLRWAVCSCWVRSSTLLSSVCCISFNSATANFKRSRMRLNESTRLSISWLRWVVSKGRSSSMALTALVPSISC